MLQQDFRDPSTSIWLNQNVWHPDQPSTVEGYYQEDLDYNQCPPLENYSNLGVYGTTWSLLDRNRRDQPNKKYCGGQVACTINPYPAVQYPRQFLALGQPKWFTMKPPAGYRMNKLGIPSCPG